jgi:hypothetical protein
MSACFRALCALALVLAVLLPMAPGALAAEPDRPLPGYRPTFVTEREAGKWEDCLWASAAMLVDKWTAGRLVISKDRLRALSGDRTGGSTLAQVAHALDRIGIHARTSPTGGDVTTWTELKRRLAAGGAAILLGDDGDLPRWFGRWDPAFWRKTGSKDNHALYLDAYDPGRDRFWVMDPLAPAGWTGEWISGAALRRFAWATPGGGLSAVLTPVAEAAPFAGVQLADPIAFAGRDGLDVTWPVDVAPKGWTMPDVTVSATITPDDGSVDPATTVVLAPAVPGVPAVPGLPAGAAAAAAPVGAAAPAKGVAPPPSVRYGDSMVQLRIATPTAAGTYGVAVALHEKRFGRSVAAASMTLYVPGERRATISTTEPMTEPVEVGPIHVDATIVNSGTVTWDDHARLPGAPLDLIAARRTHLVGTWIAAAPELVTATPAPAPVDLGFLPLAPGEALEIHATLATPTTPGRWTLVLDLVDDVDGSFAAHGSKPGMVSVDLVEAAERAIIPG